MPRKRRTIPWLKIRDEIYYVYWYDGASGRTKRISLCTGDSVEAQSRYAAFLSSGHEIFESGRGALGVSAALDQYAREHVAEKVVDRARCEMAIVTLKTWFKDTPLQDVDIPASRAFADARRSGKLLAPARGRGGKAVSDSTVRRELGVLKAAAGHAARWKRIGPQASPPTPMPSIELPLDGKPRQVFLTKEELAKAVNAAIGRLQDFILVTYYTAGRRRSVETLTRFQVDLRAGRINLTSPLETENERRSKKRRPIIPIDARIRPVVERLMSAAEKAGSEWLWGDDADMYEKFNTHMCNLGLNEKAHPHVLRHSRATHLLQEGKSIYTVAKLLGDSIATVDRVYGHHASDDLAQALTEVAL